MSKQPHKYETGQTLVWTRPSDGIRFRARILAHVEPDADDDYDEDANGPLYQVAADGTDKLQVAEVDLSPVPDTGMPADVLDGPAPRDPYTPWETEQATKKAGGVTIAALQRVNQDRLTIGAWEHPHRMRSLNLVTIRMYLDGEQTDGINLGPEDVQNMIAALTEAAAACWPPRRRHDGQEPASN